MLALNSHIIPYIQSHLAEQLTVATLAGYFNVSCTTLRRKFYQQYRVTIHKFIFIQRMERAKELIAERKYTIAEVGRMVGYTDLAHFSKAFVKYSGRRPSQLLAAAN